MNAGSLNSFYEAAASVAGALIGLLFVAITVAQERTRDRPSGTPQQIRAAAALTSFTNALAVSLFTLIEGPASGTPATVVSISGLLFVLASLLSVGTEKRALRETLFLTPLIVAFAAQLISSLRVSAHPHNLNSQRETAALVVVFFLIGIARSWELIGGPQVGLAHELKELAGHHAQNES